MLREIAAAFVPSRVSEAPKRAMQTPQREWLRGPLRSWASATIDEALSGTQGAFLNPEKVRQAADAFFRGESDNSFYIWQWITMGLVAEPCQISSQVA